ncbi:maleate cis-trans isomerase family protein [Ramlibacter sp. MAHUQ-53]|uniref:maleate cis-trans isomerase family protein n=1 Tax=unclassified Ramlibacter TaxID=2617605 RepID=UPI00363AA44A
MTRTLLGMLTPSSNTVLEPVTCDMLREVPEASAHFGRFAVTRIALSEGALAQFASPGVMQAATLLSHAHCQVIGWSGTSSSWLGFDADERLVQAIEAETGARGCTSVLALNEILARTGARRLALVTPYLDDVQAKIIANYAAAGIEVVAERHLGLEDNFSFSEVTAGQLRAMCQEVAQARPDAIAILCTNLRGGPLVPELEAELGIPVYDSVATVVWKALQLAGIDTRRIQAWGRLFKEVT